MFEDHFLVLVCIKHHVIGHGKQIGLHLVRSYFGAIFPKFYKGILYHIAGVKSLPKFIVQEITQALGVCFVQLGKAHFIADILV
jgi:hypothetical protein